MPINKLASYEEVELPIEETSQIPSYIKMNSDVNNPRFIADGMNEFERNIKRIGDFLLSGISLIIFSPLFVICYILVKERMEVLLSSSKNASGALDDLSISINSVR